MKAKELLSERTQETVRRALAKKANVLRAQIQSVAQGYTNASFIWGPAGLGKTHLITGELDSLCGKGWVHHTAYSTPKALMLTIAERPESIHLFEDCEKLYKTDVAASILRAACGSPRERKRWVTYETAHENLRVAFTGGLIVVSNEDIARAKGPLSAVASRFRPISWNMSIQERMVSILDIAKQGWRRGDWVLDPKECKQVANFLIEEMTQGEVGLAVDLRTFVEHALPAFCQEKLSKSSVEWEEVIRTKLRGSIIQGESRAEKSSRLETIASSLALDKTLNTKTRSARWTELTGLNQAMYYRHLKSAKLRK